MYIWVYFEMTINTDHIPWLSWKPCTIFQDRWSVPIIFFKGEKNHDDEIISIYFIRLCMDYIYRYILFWALLAWETIFFFLQNSTVSQFVAISIMTSMKVTTKKINNSSPWLRVNLYIYIGSLLNNKYYVLYPNRPKSILSANLIEFFFYIDKMQFNFLLGHLAIGLAHTYNIWRGKINYLRFFLK